MTFEPRGREQHEVIESTARLVVVLGGAGSGKTTTALAAARAHIERVGNGPGKRVLFLSFSRASVSRIIDGSRGVLAAAAPQVEVLTFHALAFSILRRFGSLVGVPDPILVSPARKRVLAGEAGVLAYDDLIPLALRVLRSSPTAASTIRARWGLIIVDEFQDTDDAQQELLEEVGGTARRILLGDADQCIFTFRARDGVRVERITDAAAAAGAENTVFLPDVSHRDPSGVIPGVARAIQRRDFSSAAIIEAIEQRRFEVRLGIPLEDEVEAVSATVQALRADGLGVAVFTHHNDMLAALSDGLDEAGINHEIAGLSDALAAALDAQVAMLRFAFNEAEWRDVLQELAVFVTSSVRGATIPPLARDIMAGKGATTLQARLLDIWSELDEAADVKKVLAIASSAHAALGLPAKSSAWEHAAQLLGSMRTRAARRSTQPRDERALVAAIAASAREATAAALTELAGEPHPVELMNLYQTKGREADATVVVLRDSDFMGRESEPYPNTSRLLYVVFSRAKQRIVVLLVGDARRLPGAVAPLATIFPASSP